MADLPYVESRATNSLSPTNDPDLWADEVKRQQLYLQTVIPPPQKPVGTVRWEVDEGNCQPAPDGQTHYRFWLLYSRRV
jgi:hypothetical protein